MGIFRRSTKVENRDAALDALNYAQQDRMGSPAGIAVNPDTAMRHAAWWACMELVAGVGSSLPLDEFRKVGSEQIEMPLSALFADPDPDPSITAVAWRAQILRSAVSRGNAYAELIGPAGGTPTGAVTINPDAVEWRLEKLPSGGYSWQVYVDKVRRNRWPLGDLWHFPLFLQPGSPVGLSPVQYHRNAIGGALAAQQFGQQFFDKAGLPSVLLQSPVDLTEEQAKALKAKVIDATRGTRQPLVLPSDIQYTKISISPDDSQFLDTQRYGVEEIARIVLGGFVELVGGAVSGGGSITYANREQRMADFIALSLAPRYLVPLESALSALVPRGRYVKHNVDALLRADLQGRFNAYKLNAEIASLMGGAPYTVNDMRRLENRAPLLGFDDFPVAPEPQFAPVPADPAASRADMLALIESRRDTTPAPIVVQPNVTVNMPEQRTDIHNEVNPTPVDVRTEVAAPVVNVTNEVQPTPITNDVRVDATQMELRMPDVVVNVTNEVSPTPVTVANTVNVPADSGSRKTVTYDGRGRVAEIIEEPL